MTGPAGQGKSRLRHELVARARTRDDVRVLVARGDPVGAGSAFKIVRQLVRHAVGVREGDPIVEQHAALRAYVAGRCDAADSGRIADFLGELIGVPRPIVPVRSFAPRAASRAIMAEWLRRSFGEWLAAECATRPAARRARGSALGRPAERDVPGRRAARARREAADASRARASGGPRRIPGLVARCHRPGGAPSADSRPAPPSGWCVRLSAIGSPRTQSSRIARAGRRQRLLPRGADPASRRGRRRRAARDRARARTVTPRATRAGGSAARRAASVFGEVFWRGAVADVARRVGGCAATSTRWLKTLVEREVFTAARESRFPGERDYTFRHGLLREAAYAMLTESDRTTGHRLAGEWLEAAGERTR